MTHNDREEAARLRKKADELEGVVRAGAAPGRSLGQLMLKIPLFRRIADARERRDAEMT